MDLLLAVRRVSRPIRLTGERLYPTSPSSDANQRKHHRNCLLVAVFYYNEQIIQHCTCTPGFVWCDFCVWSYSELEGSPKKHHNTDKCSRFLLARCTSCHLTNGNKTQTETNAHTYSINSNCQYEQFFMSTNKRVIQCHVPPHFKYVHLYHWTCSEATEQY